MNTKKEKVLKEKKLADKIIKEMKDAGLTSDQMLEIIKLARKKYKQLCKTT